MSSNFFMGSYCLRVSLLSLLWLRRSEQRASAATYEMQHLAPPCLNRMLRLSLERLPLG